MNTLKPMGLWAYKGNGLSTLCLLWGAVLTASAVVLYSPSVRNGGRQVMAELPGLLKAGMRYMASVFGDRRTLLLVAGLVLLGAIPRLAFMDQPIRFDEADTYLRSIDDGPLNVFYYPVPNNHVLHTLLLKIVVLLFGNSPEVLRIPAFAFGLLCIPALYLLCRRMGTSGTLACLCMAVWPYMLLYSTNARGYTLLVLLFILLTMLAHKAGTRPSPVAAVLMAAIAALGMLVMPTMLFAVAGLVLWALVLQRRNGYGPGHLLIPFGLAFPVITLFLYSPVIFVSNGTATIVANAHVTPQEWPVFLQRLPQHLAATAQAYLRDVPTGMLVLLSVLALIGIGRSYTTGKGLFLLLPCLVSGSLAVLFYTHRIPFDRTWIFLLPVVFLLVDAGGTYLWQEHVAPKWGRLVTLLMGMAFIGWAGMLLRHKPILQYPDTGTVPEARDAVAYLHAIMRPEDHLTVVYPTTTPVYYYLRLAQGRKQGEGPFLGDEYIVVDGRYQALPDVTDRPAELLTRIGQVEVYRSWPR